MIRINKYLSMCGVTSRRGAETFVKERRVTINDITLDVIRDYKVYELDRERGFLIYLIAGVLKFFDSKKSRGMVRILALFIEFILIRMSLGWLFIVTPTKKAK